MKRVSALVAAVVVAAALSSCSSDDDAPVSQPSSASETSSPTPDDTVTTDDDATETPDSDETDSDETDNASEDDPSADASTNADDDSSASDDDTEKKGSSKGSLPAWAKSFHTPGKKLTTVKGTGYTVDVYQVGVTKSTKKSSWVDPKTNKPTIKKGDKIVYVNYVVTNTSGKTIPLSYNLVDITAKYDDWPYLGGMHSITDSALDKKMKVDTFAIAPGSGDAPFKWKPGQQYAVGTNFIYEKGEKLQISTSLTPANKKGKLVHDKKTEADGSTKIR